MAELHVKGLADLQKLLDTLPAKIEANVMRSSMREGAKVLLAEATYRAPSKSAQLVSSLRIGTSRRGGEVRSYVKTDVFYARFVEFGTRPHEIKPRRFASLFFAGVFSKLIKHPGISPYGSKGTIGPHAFLRPALDAGAQGALAATAQAMRTRLSKREGLETAHIMVEGDE